MYYHHTLLTTQYHNLFLSSHSFPLSSFISLGFSALPPLQHYNHKYPFTNNSHTHHYMTTHTDPYICTNTSTKCTQPTHYLPRFPCPVLATLLRPTQTPHCPLRTHLLLLSALFFRLNTINTIPTHISIYTSLHQITLSLTHSVHSFSFNSFLCIYNSSTYSTYISPSHSH